MKQIFTTLLTVAAATALTASANAALVLNANAINTTAEGATQKVQPGGAFENAEYFPNVNFTFNETGVETNGGTLSLTSDKGYSKDITVNHMFYDMGYSEDILVMIGNEEITTSGVYTLHVPADFFTLNGEGNEAQEMVWTYTNTAESQGGDEKTLTLKTFTVNGTDMLSATAALASLEPKYPIVINIDPIEEAKMLTLKFTDEAGNSIRSMEIYDNPYNSDIEVDPATGKYKTVIAGKAINKFFEGQEYTATITAYSTTNAYSAANKTWGPVEVKFTGLSEVYKFSDVKFVSVSPEDNAEITDITQPITVTFSAPVASVKCEATEGGQGASIVSISDVTANADKTVWTIKPGSEFWRTSGAEWTFMISAKDEDGLVVEGNRGTEAGSYYSIVYGCYLAWPAVDITPASGMVEELYEFSVTEPRGIGLSYNYVPYVVDASGSEVARVDMNSQVQYDAQGRDINTLSGDVVALTAVFHLNKAITEQGKYTLVIPRSSFAMGSEYNSDLNRYMTVDYQVVKLPKVAVSVELENFGTTSFEVLEGRDATVNVAPTADWKLASLSLNGTDVTSEVTDNAYTLKNVTEAAQLKAVFEYAHEVEIIENSGIVSAGGHDYAVSNTAEYILIENLQKGDTVKVYTVNGMCVAQLTASEEIMHIHAPAGQIYVVTINDTAVKVQH